MINNIPFYQHDLGKPELDAIAEVFSGPILTTGEVVGRFEAEFASYLGCRYVLGVTSCTGALHLSLLSLGIGPGDEVITTPMTFIATATSIIEAGARPVFVDVEPQTGNIDVKKIEGAITARTRAIMPVHLFGQMCDMKAIKKIADQYELNIIEDCAHCIEGMRDGIRPGQLSDFACFSFFATKNITCGEGGAIATNRDDLIEELKLLRLHGMTKTAADRHIEGYKHWDMALLGWKYNMDNIQAAMLLPQMKRIEEKKHQRQKLAIQYEKLLNGVVGVKPIFVCEKTTHARHLFPILVDEAIRDCLIENLNKVGINVTVNYRAIHLLSYFVKEYRHQAGDFPIAENMGKRLISLPFYPTMPENYLEIVVDNLEKILNSI